MDMLRRGKSDDCGEFALRIQERRGRHDALRVKGGYADAGADLSLIGGEGSGATWEKSLKDIPLKDFPTFISSFNRCEGRRTMLS
jgi:hypothetical protein